MSLEFVESLMEQTDGKSFFKFDDIIQQKKCRHKIQINKTPSNKILHPCSYCIEKPKMRIVSLIRMWAFYTRLSCYDVHKIPSSEDTKINDTLVIRTTYILH